MGLLNITWTLNGKASSSQAVFAILRCFSEISIMLLKHALICWRQDRWMPFLGETKQRHSRDTREPQVKTAFLKFKMLNIFFLLFNAGCFKEIKKNCHFPNSVWTLLIRTPWCLAPKYPREASSLHYNMFYIMYI